MNDTYIIVPKDYDTCWMAYRNFNLGWKVVFGSCCREICKRLKELDWSLQT